MLWCSCQPLVDPEDGVVEAYGIVVGRPAKAPPVFLDTD